MSKAESVVAKRRALGRAIFAAGLLLVVAPPMTGLGSAAPSCAESASSVAYRAVVRVANPGSIRVRYDADEISLSPGAVCSRRTLATASTSVSGFGQTLAYDNSGLLGGGRIIVREGKRARQLPLLGATRQFSPTFAPNGDLAYVDIVDASGLLRLVTLSPRGPAKVIWTVATKTGRSIGGPTWLPDGRLAVLERNESGPVSRVRIFRGGLQVQDFAASSVPNAYSILALDDSHLALTGHLPQNVADVAQVVDLTSMQVRPLPPGSLPMAFSARRKAMLATDESGQLHWLSGRDFIVREDLGRLKTGTVIRGGDQRV